MEHVGHTALCCPHYELPVRPLRRASQISDESSFHSERQKQNDIFSPTVRGCFSSLFIAKTESKRGRNKIERKKKYIYMKNKKKLDKCCKLPTQTHSGLGETVLTLDSSRRVRNVGFFIRAPCSVILLQPTGNRVLAERRGALGKCARARCKVEGNDAAR